MNSVAGASSAARRQSCGSCSCLYYVCVQPPSTPHLRDSPAVTQSSFCDSTRRADWWFLGLLVTGGKIRKYRIHQAEEGVRSSSLGRSVSLQQQQTCWDGQFVDKSCPKWAELGSPRRASPAPPALPCAVLPSENAIWEKVSRATGGSLEVTVVSQLGQTCSCVKALTWEGLSLPPSLCRGVAGLPLGRGGMLFLPPSFFAGKRCSFPCTRDAGSPASV